MQKVAMGKTRRKFESKYIKWLQTKQIEWQQNSKRERAMLETLETSLW